MECEFVLIKKDMDEGYMNKVELESHVEGLKDEINFFRQLCEEETVSCSPRSQTRLWSSPWTTPTPWI